MIECTYINSEGKSVSFSSEEVTVSDGTVHGREWEPVAIQLSIGERVESWRKKAYRKNLTVVTRGTPTEHMELLDRMHDIFETDIERNIAGTLYYGSWYCKCWITSAEFSPGDLPSRINQNITVYIPAATWWKGEKVSIPKIDSDESALIYPTMYPFRYPIGKRMVAITNNNYKDSDIRIIAYGPADGVNVTIGGNNYRVNHQILSGEYMVIDSRESEDIDKRCFIMKNDGTTVNCYNDRDGDIFKKVPPGAMRVNYSRNYGIDIILIRGRSDPKWNQ